MAGPRGVRPEWVATRRLSPPPLQGGNVLACHRLKSRADASEGVANGGPARYANAGRDAEVGDVAIRARPRHEMIPYAPPGKVRPMLSLRFRLMRFGLVAAMALTARPAIAQGTLKWSFKQGDTLKYAFAQASDIKMTRDGQQNSNKIELNVDLAWSVSAVNTPSLGEIPIWRAQPMS